LNSQYKWFRVVLPLLFLASTQSWGQLPPSVVDINSQENIRQQGRERLLRQQQEKAPDVMLELHKNDDWRSEMGGHQGSDGQMKLLGFQFEYKKRLIYG